MVSPTTVEGGAVFRAVVDNDDEDSPGPAPAAIEAGGCKFGKSKLF